MNPAPLEISQPLEPERADDLLLKGNILLALLRVTEARDTYARALRADATLAGARTNLALCDTLLSQRLGQGEWTTEQVLELSHACLRQGLSARAEHCWWGTDGATRMKLPPRTPEAGCSANAGCSARRAPRSVIVSHQRTALVSVVAA